MSYKVFWRVVWPRVVGVVLVLVGAAAASAGELTDAVDAWAAELIDAHRTAALGVAIDRSGTILLNKGYGYADVENKVKATPDAIYRIGSVTKQFTAVAILQLQDAGKLKLDDPITAILTDYPPPPKPVTIKNLLQHTSGIRNFTNLPSYRPNTDKDTTHAEMITRFDALPLEFDPGSNWRYSNSGYYLLGMIIENASGESYADYLAKHVLAPALLEHTCYEAPDGSGRAQGYRSDKGELKIANTISMTQPFSAGALVSTTGDLVRWQRALVEKRTDPPDAFKRMSIDLVSMDANAEYGYGERVAQRDGRQTISHGGGIDGFSSLLVYYPQSDITIVILANTEGFDTTSVLDRIETALFEHATSP